MQHQQTSATKGHPMPLWLVATMALLYLSLLAALVFLPGASLLDRLRWLDSGICAQIPSHSFYPGGERLPLCARNTGIYLSFIVTLITLYATGRKRAQQLPPWPIVIVLVGGIAILAIDGFNSFLLDLGLPHLYQPHNLLRLTTGLITGLAMAIFTHPILNRLFWREYNQQRSLPSWKVLFAFIPALVICFFAVASQSVYTLYPLALLSSAGLLIAVSSVNLIFIIAISKRDESFERYRELLPFLGLALILAIGELLVLAQLKLTVLHALGV
ncbi:MAG TPA: DUF2085 domain-containing protein [Ktedonobacteraceae bacterium]|nr:DUF2085 domain-containing protein [Ktedonobacteraceae bacterium]